MKKFTLAILAIILLSVVSNAQITKGSTFFGGSINVYSDRSDFTPTSNSPTKTTFWSIRPQIGKAIAANKIAGIFFSVGGSSSRQDQNQLPGNATESKSSVYGGGVFYRSYYSLNQRFFLFGDAALGMSFSKDERYTTGATNYLYNKSKITEANLAITPGVSFAASKKLHLELALSSLLYLSYQSSTSTGYSSSNVVFRTSDRKTFVANANATAFNNIAIGVRWILPSKK